MVIKGNGKIGNISLQFGNTENERYMVALTKIKVIKKHILSYN